jgi:hypothetical protein
MVRHYADARVARVPAAAEIAAIEANIPGARILIEVREGMRLSELRDQDSYSFQVATVFVGANSPAEIEAKFHACMDHLPMRLETLPAP